MPKWAPDPGTRLLPGETKQDYTDRMEKHVLEILLKVDPKIGIDEETLHLKVIARMIADQDIAYNDNNNKQTDE